MYNQMKKYIILFFAILIPLLVAFLIGSYGYNSDKFGQGAWKNQYREEYLAFPEDATTEEQIEKHLEYGLNTQYYLYSKDPVYSQTVNSDGNKLFHLDIYRAIYKANIKDEDSDETIEVDRVQYLFIIYDVQYQNIRDLFIEDPNGELAKEINDANVPNLSINLTEVLEDQEEDEEVEPKTKAVNMSEISRILDAGADYDTVKGEILDEDETSTSRRLTVILGTARIDDPDWTPKTEVEIKANVPGVTDTEGNNVSTVLTTFELEMNPEAGDVSNYLSSYQQDLDRIGYFGWVFKNYLWWICLIALLATGLITLSFYGVYLAEEYENKNKKARRKIRR